jgi:hypothetical protein
MWRRRVDLVWTDVSEERIISIFGVEKFRERGTTAWASGITLSSVCWHLLTNAGTSLADCYALKMEVIHSCETSVHTRSTRHHIPECRILHNHRCENLKIGDFNADFNIEVVNRSCHCLFEMHEGLKLFCIVYKYSLADILTCLLLYFIQFLQNAFYF